MTLLDRLTTPPHQQRRQPNPALVATRPERAGLTALRRVASWPRLLRRRETVVAGLAVFAVLMAGLVDPIAVPITLSAAATGFFNVVGGGGAVINFLTLTAVGVAALTAHATSRLVSPASFVRALSSVRDHAPGRSLVIVGCLGTLVGAALVTLATPTTFHALAPFFLAPAAVLVVAHGPVQRRVHRMGWTLGPTTTTVAMFGSGIYAGLIGVGMGTLVLVVLGLTRRHGAAVLPELLTVCNVLLLGMATVAMLAYAVTGLVNWTLVLLLAPPCALGGWIGTTFINWLGTGPAKDTAIRLLRAMIALTALAGAIWMAL